MVQPASYLEPGQFPGLPGLPGPAVGPKGPKIGQEPGAKFIILSSLRSTQLSHRGRLSAALTVAVRRHRWPPGGQSKPPARQRSPNGSTKPRWLTYLPSLSIGNQNHNFYLVLGWFPGRTWPRDPFQRVGLEKCCRTHPKFAPETNSKAVS